MGSILLLSFLVVFGIVFIGLVFLPMPILPFGDAGQNARSLAERMRARLFEAGIFDAAPSYVLAGVAVASITAGLIFTILLGTLLAAPLGPIVVVAGGWIALRVRERRFMSRIIKEMPPFLSRVATSVRAGIPARNAYIEAVESAGELKKVLGDSASKLVAGAPLAETLEETITLLPGLRLWSEFVGQIQQHERGGGDLAESLDLCIRLSNKVLTLQAKVRAQAAQEQMQQVIIVIIAVGAVLVMVATDWDNNKVMFTSKLGIAGTIIAALLMAFGTWISRKQTNDAVKQVMN